MGRNVLDRSPSKFNWALAGLLSTVVFISHLPTTESALADTWDDCNCRWDPWQAWEDCNSNCYGTRRRERSVWLTQYPGCDEFTDCATNDEAYSYSPCNQNCQNGGTPSTSSCSCLTGFYGTCCSYEVNCGTPTSISNGGVSYGSTNYGSLATYYCDQHYNLTDGSEVRTCQLSHAWSGTLPRCAYVNHCASTPCQNGATCTDLLDDYECTCLSGWSGKDCDTDIQPPVMSGCPADVALNATNTTKSYSWTTPTFEDPLGNDLVLTQNYPIPSYDFPWGDFVVQYTATKVNNGLSAQCEFRVSVRPTPCEELNIPVNGARICNNWQTDYGRFCVVACNSAHMIDPAYNFEMVYVCGATGYWLASETAPDCDVEVYSVQNTLTFHPEYLKYSYNTSCTDTTTTQQLQDLYIDQLTGSDARFDTFCSSFPDECGPTNVEVVCS